MADLTEYRRKRDPGRTPEPVPSGDTLPRGDDDVFVIQEHHATRLHWDLRLERDGVLVSWAVPLGLPMEPDRPRLAVHTEDHPLEYASFHGEIPAGEYGAGRMTIWDHGRYETLHFNDHKVEVLLHGERVRGRYALVNQHSPAEPRAWRIRRVDPPPCGWEELPSFVSPMRPVQGKMPSVDEDVEWAYEFRWEGLRTLARVQGGRISLRDGAGGDITADYPELRALGARLGSTEALLDGQLVVFDHGVPSLSALRQRESPGSTAKAKRLAARFPVLYLPFDLLHLDGRSCLDLGYLERRALLDGLGLDGPSWRVPDFYVGDGGAVLRAGREHGLPGMLAKRTSSRYRPDRRSADWISITGVQVCEVVIGGWREGGGKRAGSFGSLLLGLPDGDRLRYVGNVGTGFSDRDLETLSGRLHRLSRKTSPFHTVPPATADGTHWVRAELVGEVVFRDWTKSRCLRTPSWRGLLPGRAPADLPVRA
nr:DNA polymerase ligase N-terminal domain-containing protein [Amycolatopsis nigrescens]